MFRSLLFTVCLTPLVVTANARADDSKSQITSVALDALIAQSRDGAPGEELVDDEQFFRRISLDLIGRPPKPAELEQFIGDSLPGKRQQLIDRLLAGEEYGRHWANYWRDTIRFRVPPPQLTFLDYGSFQGWLSERLNANDSWGAITRAILTGSGPVKENPAATFVGYHQGNAVKLGAETARVFLGLQLQCAECHDHPYEEWKREQFHALAAFYGRTKGELGKVQDGSGTIVSDRGKDEYRMPNAADPTKKGLAMQPALMTGENLPLGKPDLARRQRLANLITLPDNPWFARAYVNRIWARLMGRGFQEPVDDTGDNRQQYLPVVHKALTAHFTATGFDIKDLFRLITSTHAYQSRLQNSNADEKHRVAGSAVRRLRGDVVFDSLVSAIGLPNTTPPKVAATDEFRFPPPPKSTRDLVVDTFGADPSVPENEQPRTMGQAMFLMNNEQLQKQIDADPKSDTRLSRLLEKHSGDRQAVEQLYLQVLARKPTDKEMELCHEHLYEVKERGEAFEDILWGLINSAEFTTKR